MKILCDVCDKEAAVMFCSADEAALCGACDRSVHHANNLAGKHTRFSLLHPTKSPLCDICRERRAFVFCQQDRALLCRECDVPIHRANEYTMEHNRFLLTGVKLSSSIENPLTTVSVEPNYYAVDDEVSVSTTSISEYLMETLPGWRVDDFLEPNSSSAAINGYFH
ncbi:B-box zinc finger protein 20 [Hibiscus syriacus]|uniref:B-box zinc finger protein 20 n=1 Tax=Hibiscus syriacus TaxID=106335 RepID=A0A6A2YK55_HIBSY|nr:B-box zinc finger protein 20 [Hibiscus syriacus]KAE8680029.1 B-box zinc finger protein 20 [Hibiscus syriacus]